MFGEPLLDELNRIFNVQPSPTLSLAVFPSSSASNSFLPGESFCPVDRSGCYHRVGIPNCRD